MHLRYTDHYNQQQQQRTYDRAATYAMDELLSAWQRRKTRDYHLTDGDLAIHVASVPMVVPGDKWAKLEMAHQAGLLHGYWLAARVISQQRNIAAGVA